MEDISLQERHSLLEMEMLDKIDSPTEYINAISKLLPYSIGKVKSFEDVEEIEPVIININFVDTKEEE